eukprot:m.139593 g.139593  ORF g.139593 m.139593 type:complete len:160 (-) comp30068_c0_seq4:179-658(-)
MQAPKEMSFDTQKLKTLFEFFDTDSDGTISKYELGRVMRALGNNPTQVEIEAMMAEFDVDKSNGIDFTEFERLVARELQGGAGTDPHEIVHSFRIFDQERSGFLPVDQFKEIMLSMGEKFSETEVENMLSHCTLRDGKINYEEFVHNVVRQASNKSVLE